MSKQGIKRINNRATFQNDAVAVMCENCGEELLFSMKDNYHEFTIGLSTIIKCVRVAENSGYLPKNTPEWWDKVITRYHNELCDRKS